MASDPDPPLPGNYSATTARLLLSRIADAESLRERRRGLKPQEAVSIVRSILGSAATLPVNCDGQFWGRISRSITSNGLTAEDVERLAERAKAGAVRLPIGVHYLLSIAGKVLKPERNGLMLAEVSEEEGEGTVEVKTGREDG